MARDATTIYIDDASIRVLGVSGKRPRKWAADPLDAKLVRDGFIVDEPAVAARVRTLWAKEQMGSGRVIAGISGINCLYRLLSLPELPKNLLPEAVRREASRAFGLPLDQLYISWQTLPSQKQGETLVYVTGATRTTVDTIVRTLKRAGLNPYMMDIAPLALARATAEQHALIVDLQMASLDIVIKMDRMPEVVRSVPVSRAASPDERLNLVKQEMQRAVTFYNSSHPDAPIGDDIPILVAGELGERQDLWPQLLGRVERRIEPLATPLESPADFMPFAYAPLVGLALKEFGRDAEGYSRINFNALPEAYIPRPRPLAELLFPPALIVAGLAIAAMGFLVFNAYNLTDALRGRDTANTQLITSLAAQVNTERGALEEERDGLTATLAETEETAQAKEDRANALDGRLRSFSLQEQTINTDLGEINRTPAGVHLASVSHGGSIVNLSGTGANEQAVFTYARQLRASGHWSLVTLTNMSTADVRTSFSMVLYE